MSVIGRDVMERGAPPWGLEAPSTREVRESLSHTDMQAWAAASSHNRPEAARSAAVLSGEERATRGRICCCCCCLESTLHTFPTGLLYSLTQTAALSTTQTALSFKILCCL